MPVSHRDSCYESLLTILGLPCTGIPYVTVFPRPITHLQSHPMHRLRTRSAIWRLRAAALLFWLCCIAFLGMISAFVMAFMERSRDQVEIAIISTISFMFLAMAQWLISLKTKCPLCLTAVLASKNCAKHRNARTFLGSYRLRVANRVLLSNHFRCPYCGELTELAVRQRRPH